MSLASKKNSTKDYDYLPNEPLKFEGTVHAGGISYSGADIKVVVNVYNTQEKQSSQFQKQAEKERTRLDVEEKRLLKRQAEAEGRHARTGVIQHRGTNEGRLAVTELNKIRKQLDANHKKRVSLDEREKVQASKTTDKPPTIVLADAQTLSISSYRDKAPVRSLGSVYPKGYTRGPRQIGGNIVFTVFDRDVMYDFLETHPSDFDGNRQSTVVLDQLPPVDIIISFANELGSVSRMAIYGVEFISAGQIMSIEDIMTENVVEYVARDFDPMTNVGVVDLHKPAGSTLVWQSKSASDLLTEGDYQDIKGAVDPFERFKRRNNPFL